MRYKEDEYSKAVCLNCYLTECKPNSKTDCLLTGMRGDKMLNVFNIVQKFKVVDMTEKENPNQETIKYLDFLAESKIIKKAADGRYFAK